MIQRISLSLCLLISSFVLCSQGNPDILNLMGHGDDDKLLIMHADDLGLSHAVNQASIQAFEQGRISSASIMVPCPWFSEIADYARTHPQYCWGLHLTLTAEWKYYKWDGVAPSSEITSLLNSEGFFYDNVADFVENASLEEVDIELRAQIDQALKAGIPVSHLDSHMGALFANKDLFKLYVELGNDYEIPVLIPGSMLPPSWKEGVEFGIYHQPVNQLMMMQVKQDDWAGLYNGLIENAKIGINEIIVHLGFDDAEMQAIMMDHPSFGAAWRQQDFNYVMSEIFYDQLKANGLELVSFKQIKAALDKE